ncbi:hypothetical protein SERLA73DRAFT_76630 [Serpula lacrymans var. lacrymans S7.3]|uniref:Uncharacterized protein n=1 Tax=Serpula lacrymans var. lacrymans (strain S7.3) TaxID=936435 RepID=F8Q7I9_SERL3|nr:hypothetical protein SERLA73DRAFT_76630 [Serpula lacrymans var. lacrymans S7.3]
MLLDLKSRLFSTQFSIQRYLAPKFQERKEPYTCIDALFQDNIHKYSVAQWQDMMTRLPEDVASRCFVHTLEFCKESRGAEHEFLLAYIRHPNPNVSTRSLVKIERFVNTDQRQAQKREGESESGDPRKILGQVLGDFQ